MADLSEEDAAAEHAAFARVLAAFRAYPRFALAANQRRRRDFYALPRADREVLGALGYAEKLNAVDDAIAANARFLLEVVSDPEIFANQAAEEASAEEEERTAIILDEPHEHTHDGHSHDHGHTHAHTQPDKPTDADMDKVRSTLKQIARDWAAAGAREREACYAPIEAALLAHFSDIPPDERLNFRVLVPGAGLGRLAWNVAHHGFACQGNEFSHYMLLASFFILNRTTAVEQHTLHPYLHSLANLPDRAAALAAARVPDVAPASLPPGADFSLVAGDFEEVYNAPEHEGAWDAVLTCFFIDTAKNVVNYLRIIHKLLAPGGVWINLGPLLWHWEGAGPSVELDLAEVRALARAIGFDVRDERSVRTTYTGVPRGMLSYAYDTAFWVATKVDV